MLKLVEKDGNRAMELEIKGIDVTYVNRNSLWIDLKGPSVMEASLKVDDDGLELLRGFISIAEVCLRLKSGAVTTISLPNPKEVDIKAMMLSEIHSMRTVLANNGIKPPPVQEDLREIYCSTYPEPK